MKDVDKFLSDIARWKGAGPSGQDPAQLEALRRMFFEHLRAMPNDLLSDIFMDFLERYSKDGETGRARAIAWLSGIASLFSGEYDGTPFSSEDWESLRESVSANAGDMDIDLLTEIMSLILEHDALS
jgi:hypothetical protein